MFFKSQVARVYPKGVGASSVIEGWLFALYQDSFHDFEECFLGGVMYDFEVLLCT